MADLTPKQEAFALAYIETGSASEAYRRAYCADEMKPETLNKRASELLAHGGVAGRIESLRAPVREAVQLTLKQHLEDLKRLRDLAEQDGKYGPAIQAEVARGKAAGLYVEKQEITGKDGSPLISGISVSFVKPNAGKD